MFNLSNGRLIRLNDDNSECLGAITTHKAELHIGSAPHHDCHVSEDVNGELVHIEISTDNFGRVSTLYLQSNLYIYTYRHLIVL